MYVDVAQGSPDLEQRLGAASPGEMVYAEGFRLLSRAAVDLHAFAGLSSITEGHPEFVSDDYLIAPLKGSNDVRRWQVRQPASASG